MSGFWRFLADNLGAAARFCRQQTLPAGVLDSGVTGTSRWLPNAEDSTLEQYVQEAAKFVQGRRCNVAALREIEAVPLGPNTPGVSEADAPNYRRHVVAALEAARSLPLSTRNAVGASQVVPDLVHRIDYHLNGDPTYRNLPQPPANDGPTLIVQVYVRLLYDAYRCGKPVCEEFMRGIEKAGDDPIPEQGADDFRRAVFDDVELGAMTCPTLTDGGYTAYPALVKKAEAYLSAVATHG